MTEPISPDKIITLCGNEYKLDSSLGTLKRIQEVFDTDIFDMQEKSLSLRFDEMSKLLTIGIEGGGAVPPLTEEIEEFILREEGIDSIRYEILEWMTRALCPDRDRKKKILSLEKTFKKMLKPSLGGRTKSSA